MLQVNFLDNQYGSKSIIVVSRADSFVYTSQGLRETLTLPPALANSMFIIRCNQGMAVVEVKRGVEPHTQQVLLLGGIQANETVPRQPPLSHGRQFRTAVWDVPYLALGWQTGETRFV